MLYTHIPDISCFYTDTINSNLLTPTAHFEYEMLLITDGQAEVHINHHSYQLSKGSLLFISRLERHDFFIKTKPYCRFVVSMSSQLLLSRIQEMELISVFLQRPDSFSHMIQLHRQTYEKILPLFQQMTDEYIKQSSFYISKSVSLFLSILIELYRDSPEYFPAHSHSNISEIVLNAQRYIGDHFQRKLTLQEIADANYISRHTLSLAFKELAGITFKDYLILFRISEAKKLLLTSDLSIAEIAEQVGYVNVNNFLKIFKEREQITPLQYKKLANSNSLL